MRCPDCQSEIQDGVEVCPRCFAVLQVAPEESPSDLWRDPAAQVGDANLGGGGSADGGIADGY